MYRNKVVHVATKHQKEKAIESSFKSILGCSVKSTMNFDTDEFGTFSGEIERQLSPYRTCVKKAESAAEKFKLDYVIASEGSFGPHPTMIVVPSATEIIVFYDATNQRVISEQLVTTHTNYAYHNLFENAAYEDYLKAIQFPSHHVILRDLNTKIVLGKGISDYDNLSQLVHDNINKYNTLRIETDMRAHCNPTRMKVIEQLAERLALRINRHCPACDTPGFGERAAVGQLSCEACDAPTELYQNSVLSCSQCDHQTMMMREDGLVSAPAQYCPQCNP